MASERACPHCGAPLRRMTAEVGGREVSAGWKPCRCDGARAERAERLAEAERERLEDERLRHLRRRERAGIPRRYLRAEHPDAPALLAGLGEGLYITGAVGAGKTHLACAVSLSPLAIRRASSERGYWLVAMIGATPL